MAETEGKYSRAINMLSEDQRSKLLNAIYEYVLLGVTPEFEGDLMITTAWAILKPGLSYVCDE